MVRMSTIVDGAAVGDQCKVKMGQTFYSDAKILAIGKCIEIKLGTISMQINTRCQW